MNNLTDEKIRKLVADSKVELPEGYEDKIDSLLNQLDESEKKTRFAWKRAAAIFIIFLLVGSAGVYATISGRNRNLENLSDTQKQQFLDDASEANTERDSYSRELSDTEEERLEELKIAYNIEGKSPQKSLSLVAYGNQVTENKLCFVTSESKFYFPEREMTDEELLEIIDFYYKRDYSIRALGEKNVQSRTTVPEDHIVQLAEKYVKSIYDIDLSGSRYTLDKIEDSEITVYLVGISTKDAERYEVTFQPDSDMFDSVTKVNSDNFVDDIQVDRQLYREKLTDTKDIIEKFADLRQIAGSSINYVYKDDGILKNGIITYAFEMSDGSGYFLYYSCAHDEIYSMVYMKDMNSYYEVLENNRKVEERLGFRREKVELGPVVFLSE